MYPRRIRVLLSLSILVAGTAALSTPVQAAPNDIQKIQHIVIIMQENRSFDSYFGTYPGVNGIPMQNGVPTLCVNDPQTGQCVKPFHDVNDINGGGPHGQVDATADINGGKMDGFIAQAEHTARKGCGNNPECTDAPSDDVMGYHTDAEIPNYWTYAKNFVLQDAMYEPNASWSLPEHLFLVSSGQPNVRLLVTPQAASMHCKVREIRPMRSQGLKIT